MIIKKGQTNTCCFTLSERTTLDPVYYLFKLVSKEESNTTNSVKCFIAEDISQNKIRYNEFEIEENDTEDLLNGIVSLPEGQYDYFIYEQSSNTNLDTDNAHLLVDQGMIDVIGDDIEYTAFTSTQTIKTFNG